MTGSEWFGVLLAFLYVVVLPLLAIAAGIAQAQSGGSDGSGTTVDSRTAGHR